MKEKTLWFRAGVGIPMTEQEYEMVCKAGKDGASDCPFFTATAEEIAAARNLLISKFRNSQFRLTGETYAPAIMHEPAESEWPQPEDLTFDFDVSMQPSAAEKIEVKVIRDEKNSCSYVLTNSTVPMDVEMLVIDDDYDDYEQMDAYRDELHKDPQYRKIDLNYAAFESEPLLNTKISYLYRDGGNYKVHNEAIIRGELSQEQIRRILCSCNLGWDSLTFIPSKVGLPEKKLVDEGYEFDAELDHDFFEINESDFEITEEDPTVEITASELVAAFEMWTERWYCDTLPVFKPVKVTTIHFESVEEGASSTQFDTQDFGELMELFYTFLKESNLTLAAAPSIEYGEAK